MKRIFVFASFLVFLFSAGTANASLITVHQDGKMSWNVLGAIAFSGNNAQYINSKEIVLRNNDGKVSLNDIDISNYQDNIVEFKKEIEPERVSIVASGENFLIMQRGVAAETTFPIKISEKDENLILKTETGDRYIAVLPYEALMQAVRSDYIEEINSDGKIEIIENDEGEIAYKISGEKKYSIFKFFDLPANVDTYVSALTGNILKVDQPVWSRVLGFLLT